MFSVYTGWKRTAHAITLEKWDDSDRFMRLSDDFCYSFKEIKGMYDGRVKKLLSSNTDYDKNDRIKMEIISRLPISIVNETEGGYTKKKKNKKSRKTKRKNIRRNKKSRKM